MKREIPNKQKRRIAVPKTKARNLKELMATHKRASKFIFIAGFLLACAAVLSLFTMLVLVFFPVEKIEVYGDSPYTYTEIMDASGVREGKRVFYLNEKKAERKILTSLPYIKDAEVEAYFPNRVVINIYSYDNIYFASHERGYCYLSDEFDILEIVEEKPEFERFNNVYIRFSEKLYGEVGENAIRLEEARKEEIEAAIKKAIKENLELPEPYTSTMLEEFSNATELISKISAYPFYNRLNIVDIENKYDVSFVVGKQSKYVLGAMTDIEEKIEISLKIFDYQDLGENIPTVINSTNKKQVVFRHISDEELLKEFDFCKN